MNIFLGMLGAYLVSLGGAFQVAVEAESGLIGGTARFDGSEVPLTRVGDAWIALFGVDLDDEAGPRPVDITLNFEGRATEQRRDEVTIQSQAFPTTRLEVEPRFVELAPEDQERAGRESAEIAAVYGTVTPRRYWQGAFQIPLAGVSGGRNFGHRRVFNGQPRAPHSGSDLAATTGTPVAAMNAGHVVLAKELFFSGKAVFLDHGLGLYSVYLHLSRIDVAVGDRVDAGQTLGLVGATGRVTGPHLHWGVRILGARIDPFSLLDLNGD
jgi:murein DD-endopeptidase MepM/ murein hydrolase activator NlpD